MLVTEPALDTTDINPVPTGVLAKIPPELITSFTAKMSTLDTTAVVGMLTVRLLSKAGSIHSEFALIIPDDVFVTVPPTSRMD